jgi:hypothetical protein
MNTRDVIKGFTAGLIALSTAVLATTSSAPANWFVSSQIPGAGIQNYEAAIDHDHCDGGRACALFKSRSQDTGASGTLMQAVDATSFKGKRIRLSASLKTLALPRGAGLWMRAENAAGGIIAFKNYQSVPSENSAVRGDSEWTHVELVQDVPDSAAALFYGVILNGTGKVWISHVRVDVLGNASTESTDTQPTRFNQPSPPAKLLPQPTNLDFED